MKNNNIKSVLKVRSFGEQKKLPVTGSPDRLSYLGKYEEYADDITNEHGSIRRCFVYSQYMHGFLSLEDVTDIYRIYRDDPEYICLEVVGIDPLSQERIIPLNNDYEDPWFIDGDVVREYRFVKASKRGNDVFRSRLIERLKVLEEIPPVTFFNDHDVDKRTNALFLTLTFDPSKYDVKTAWSGIGCFLNKFLSNLRKIYGSIAHIRVFESTKKYYPHVHILILFWDHSFPVIQHLDKDNRVTWRIPYKEKIKIASYWKYGLIDVQAIQTTNEAFSEITKYLVKDLCSKKGDITNSMLWLFRKQSYSISKNFVDWLKNWYLGFEDLTVEDLKEPDDDDFDDLIKGSMRNSNLIVIHVEFVGIIRGFDLGVSGCVHEFSLRKPPPRILDLIRKERDRRSLLKYSRFSGGGF